MVVERLARCSLAGLHQERYRIKDVGAVAALKVLSEAHGEGCG